MLFKQKIISFQVKNKIIYGLKRIENEILKNKFKFNKKNEDIHMNIEKDFFKLLVMKRDLCTQQGLERSSYY